MDTNDFLAHYASKYYDPVKAHEYYMRTRELKGRQRSTAALNEEGKKVWAYTKEQIDGQKKVDKAKAKLESEQKMKDLRAKAEKTKAAISQSLKKFEETLAKRRTAELEKLMGEKIPEGLSEEERAKRIAARNKKISKIYSDSKKDRARKAKSLSAEQSQVAAELQSAISAARETYNKTREGLDASYETVYQEEYDKILSEYSKK